MRPAPAVPSSSRDSTSAIARARACRSRFITATYARRFSFLPATDCGAPETMPGGGSRLGEAFAAIRGSTGLIPYLTAGYPSLDVSLELMRRLERLGVLALEIGIPFSDPIADGPEIQRASEWALRLGVGPHETLDLIENFRSAGTLPIVIMTYANPVLRGGVEA